MGSRWGSLVIKVLSSFVLFVAGLYLVVRLGPLTETAWFPVISKLSILSINAGDNPNTTLVDLKYQKFRTCEYLGLSWYYVDLKGSEMPVAVDTTPNTSDASGKVLVTRAPGSYEGHWLVSIPPDQLIGRSHVQIAYRCHPLWVTIAELYP